MLNFLRLFSNSSARRHRAISPIVRMLAAAVLMSNIASSQAQSPAAPEATFNLSASERNVDEGDVVQFIISDKEYWDPSTGRAMRFEADLSPVVWNFDDARQAPASGYGLYDMKHWFLDDREAPYVVEATHQGNTEMMEIRVNDVLPIILRVSVTENPRKDSPVTFQGAVWDPGMDDDITFTWDFGGGDTATGRNARKTWSETGVHNVELSVKDEARNDPPQTFTFPVVVGDEQYFEDNTFSAFGDIAGTSNEIDGLVLVGSTGNVTESNAEGRCQIRIEMRSSEADMGVVLTAHLYPGLAPGVYTIGETKEWAGSHVQDVASRGTFFAEFIPPQDRQYRTVGGRKIGGPFWSDRGTVTVRKFEAGELELIFDAVFTENIPATIDRPRQVAVMGALLTDVPTAVTASDVTEPSSVTGIPGLDTLARSLQSRGRDISSEDRSDMGVKYYNCAGQEPEEFELVAAVPGANGVNYNFEGQSIEVEFSQSVDSDSIVHPDTLEDNLLLAIRGNEGYARVGGSWMVSQQNPRVVQFLPQSRLMPGTIHCVYVVGGEKGLRSFTGNLLSGSSLDTPQGQMAAACSLLDSYQLSHAFSTRVELESIGVSLYQRSLLGPHAPFVSGGPIWNFAIARVYPWWQNASRNLHPSSAVSEFDARVFAVSDRQRMEPFEFNETRLKRPDLYSDEERRTRKHSVEFVYTPNGNSGSFDYFSVVQPLNEVGAPVDPVDSSRIRQMETKIGLVLNVGLVQLEVNCANELSPEECGGDYWEPVDIERFSLSPALVYLRHIDLPISDLIETSHVETLSITEACPGGVINEVCFDSFQVQAESDASFGPWRQALANQIVNSSSLFEDPDFFEDTRPAFDILFAALPPSMIDTDQVESYLNRSYGVPILFFQAAVNQIALRQAAVKALLQDEACDFSGRSSCSHTPIQGFVMGGEGYTGSVHHAEGNEFGGSLIPLAKDVDPDEHSWASFHISAYNYARLYEALERD